MRRVAARRSPISDFVVVAAERIDYKSGTMDTLSDIDAVQVADGIWWVGFADREAGFSNNPYLLIDGEESVLFDPGPGHPVFRDLLLRKIRQVVDPATIRYVVVHHQDPDLCGLIPHLEPLLHPDTVLVATPRTALFLPYYGIRKGILPVGDRDVLELRSGLRIVFHHLPYLHFAGNMASFVESSGTLFSSDLFAVLNRRWSLFADPSYRALAIQFIEMYMGCKSALDHAYRRLRSLPIRQILPQHGGIIAQEHVEDFLEVLREAEPGKMLADLLPAPDEAQTDDITVVAADCMAAWTGERCGDEDLEQLFGRAVHEGAAAVQILDDAIARRARELGVAHPLRQGRVHRFDRLRKTAGGELVRMARSRLMLSHQERLVGGSSASVPFSEGPAMSFKTRVAVLSTDVRGFTPWSSGLDPEVVLARLTQQHDAVSRVVQSTGGRVNKLLGDGLLAYYWADDVDRAVRAAIRIQALIKAGGHLPCGVGCAFGEVVIGDVGREWRHDFTIIGEPVNVAFRMSDHAREGEVMISEGMWRALSEGCRAGLEEQFAPQPAIVRAKPSDPEMPGYRLRVH